MPIRNASSPGKYLWLLAHPDDEIFGLPLFFKTNSLHTFIYFSTNSLRSSETLSFFAKLKQKNIKIDNVYFLNFHDGHISNSIVFPEYKLILDQLNLSEYRVVSLSFEFGHQDHDAVNIIAKLTAKLYKLDLLELTAYQSKKMFPGFKVMCNDEANEHYGLRIRLQASFLSLKSMFYYRSQWKTWMGLGIFIFIRYLVNWNFKVIRSCEVIIPQQPVRKPLYEKRKKSEFGIEKKNLTKLIRNSESYLDV